MEERQTQQVDDRISPLDYLIVLLKRKKLILFITFVFAVITAVISLIMPEIYRAETTLLRSAQRSPGMTSVLLNQFGSVAGIAGSMFGMSSPNALYVALLKSRPVLEGVVKQFNLTELYGVETVVDASMRLKKKITAKYNNKTSIITLAVEDKDPEMAADLANALVKELKNLTKRLAITEAAQRRVFFGEQLKDAKELLIKAEEEMASFQAETGILKIDEQTEAVIKAIANLRAKIAEKEVQLKVMRTYSMPNNPDLQKVEEALNGLKEELRKLKKGQAKGSSPILATERMPEVGTEYIRRLRELKFSETLYNLFLKQYEAAKIDEARDALLVQVIDEAIPPEKRASPRRTRMVVISVFPGFIFGVFMALFLEYREKISDDPKHRERLKMLRKYTAIRLKK